MANIIQATTPTIIYRFKTAPVENITVAYLTIKKNGNVVLEKDIDSATVTEDALAWTLTQEETLIWSGSLSFMLNWKLADGTRGASAKSTVKIDDNYKAEVI